MDSSAQQLDWLQGEHGTAILTFNFLPLSYIHASWRDALAEKYSFPTEHEDFTAYILNDGSSYLQRWFLESHQLDKDFDFNFESPLKRIALLDYESIASLSYWLAIALTSENIRTLLSANHVAMLKELLGDDGYDFALYQAPFLLGAWPKSLRVTLTFSSIEALDESLQTIGFSALFSLLQEYPHAFNQRLKFKLPEAISKGVSPLPLENASDVSQLLIILRKIIRQNKVPACTHLFP